AGTEGDFVTSRHLDERLQREILTDVAIVVEELTTGVGYKVSGRGELHLSILIEKMRREGYEFQITCPQVIFKESANGKKLEPYEELTVDVSDEYAGKVIEKLGMRKGQMLEMETERGMTRLKFKVPTRGLLGYRSDFMSDTKGMGQMSYVFAEYADYAGDMTNRKNGALVSMVTGVTVAFALFNLQERGDFFLDPGEKIYEGQIVGENSRDGDLTVNPAKGKQLTNVRASGTDESVSLIPPRNMSLEDCISFINEDELLELTPKNIRLRKRHLTENDRKRNRLKKAD
ncbi:MAG: translational GTPase TypA, partial [Lentisphaeria bacterium]|nr:translational GTPase TypA [Lentisphaeria bacterium]